MNIWPFTLIFCFAILYVLRYLVDFLIKFFSNPPKRLTLSINEQLIGGFVISYIITYLIY